MKPPNCWLYLRHPDGFTDEFFKCFQASCKIWQARVEATVAVWEYLLDLRSLGLDKPDYSFSAPEISSDRKTVTLPYYSNATHGSKHVLEYHYPSELYCYFPQWFTLELELGRLEEGWRTKEIWWQRLYTPEKVRMLKNHPLFRRPGIDGGLPIKC